MKGVEMPKTPKQMVKILKKSGFVKVSQNGSHLKMRNSEGVTAVVPMHNKDLPKGLEQDLLKKAETSRTENLK
jgi:predicted RNA binding protein YcfA (HicA-like mRNA interferase family)